MKKVKEWIEVLQKQLGALGIESIEDYYNIPMIWVQKVGVNEISEVCIDVCTHLQ